MLPTYEKIKLDQRVKAKGRYNLIRTEINNLEKKINELAETVESLPKSDSSSSTNDTE